MWCLVRPLEPQHQQVPLPVLVLTTRILLAHTHLPFGLCAKATCSESLPGLFSLKLNSTHRHLLPSLCPFCSLHLFLPACKLNISLSVPHFILIPAAFGNSAWYWVDTQQVSMKRRNKNEQSYQSAAELGPDLLLDFKWPQVYFKTERTKKLYKI